MWPLGGADSDWILNNDVGIKWTNYPTSSAARKDWELSHAVALVYAISARFEARSTLTSIWNFSNSSLYDFSRYQVGLSLSYIF